MKCHDTLGWQFIDDIPQAPWVELKQVYIYICIHIEHIETHFYDLLSHPSDQNQV